MRCYTLTVSQSLKSGVAMFNVRQWGKRSNEAAVCNARAAATELSRARVERDEVENFLADVAQRRTSGQRPA